MDHLYAVLTPTPTQTKYYNWAETINMIPFEIYRIARLAGLVLTALEADGRVTDIAPPPATKT